MLSLLPSQLAPDAAPQRCYATTHQRDAGLAEACFSTPPRFARHVLHQSLQAAEVLLSQDLGGGLRGGVWVREGRRSWKRVQRL